MKNKIFTILVCFLLVFPAFAVADKGNVELDTTELKETEILNCFSESIVPEIYLLALQGGESENYNSEGKTRDTTLSSNTICQYPSCSEVPISQCKNKIESCQYLSCSVEFGKINFETNKIDETKCVKKETTSTSINYNKETTTDWNNLLGAVSREIFQQCAFEATGILPNTPEFNAQASSNGIIITSPKIEIGNNKISINSNIPIDVTKYNHLEEKINSNLGTEETLDVDSFGDETEAVDIFPYDKNKLIFSVSSKVSTNYPDITYQFGIEKEYQETTEIDSEYKNSENNKFWLHNDFMNITEKEGSVSEEILEGRIIKQAKLTPAAKISNHAVKFSIAPTTTDLFFHTDYQKYLSRTGSKIYLGENKRNITIFGEGTQEFVFNPTDEEYLKFSSEKDNFKADVRFNPHSKIIKLSGEGELELGNGETYFSWSGLNENSKIELHEDGVEQVATITGTEGKIGTLTKGYLLNINAEPETITKISQESEWDYKFEKGLVDFYTVTTHYSMKNGELLAEIEPGNLAEISDKIRKLETEYAAGNIERIKIHGKDLTAVAEIKEENLEKEIITHYKHDSAITQIKGDKQINIQSPEYTLRALPEVTTTNKEIEKIIEEEIKEEATYELKDLNIKQIILEDDSPVQTFPFHIASINTDLELEGLSHKNPISIKFYFKDRIIREEQLVNHINISPESYLSYQGNSPTGSSTKFALLLPMPDKILIGDYNLRIEITDGDRKFSRFWYQNKLNEDKGILRFLPPDDVIKESINDLDEPTKDRLINEVEGQEESFDYASFEEAVDKSIEELILRKKAFEINKDRATLEQYHRAIINAMYVYDEVSGGNSEIKRMIIDFDELVLVQWMDETIDEMILNYKKKYMLGVVETVENAYNGIWDEPTYPDLTDNLWKSFIGSGGGDIQRTVSPRHLDKHYSFDEYIRYLRHKSVEYKANHEPLAIYQLKHDKPANIHVSSPYATKIKPDQDMVYVLRSSSEYLKLAFNNVCPRTRGWYSDNTDSTASSYAFNEANEEVDLACKTIYEKRADNLLVYEEVFKTNNVPRDIDTYFQTEKAELLSFKTELDKSNSFTKEMYNAVHSSLVLGYGIGKIVPLLQKVSSGRKVLLGMGVVGSVLTVSEVYNTGYLCLASQSEEVTTTDLKEFKIESGVSPCLKEVTIVLIYSAGPHSRSVSSAGKTRLLKDLFATDGKVGGLGKRKALKPGNPKEKILENIPEAEILEIVAEMKAGSTANKNIFNKVFSKVKQKQNAKKVVPAEAKINIKKAQPRQNIVAEKVVKQQKASNTAKKQFAQLQEKNYNEFEINENFFPDLPPQAKANVITGCVNCIAPRKQVNLPFVRGDAHNVQFRNTIAYQVIVKRSDGTRQFGWIRQSDWNPAANNFYPDAKVWFKTNDGNWASKRAQGNIEFKKQVQQKIKPEVKKKVNGIVNKVEEKLNHVGDMFKDLIDIEGFARLKVTKAPTYAQNKFTTRQSNGIYRPDFVAGARERYSVFAYNKFGGGKIKMKNGYQAYMNIVIDKNTQEAFEVVNILNKRYGTDIEIYLMGGEGRRAIQRKIVDSSHSDVDIMLQGPDYLNTVEGPKLVRAGVIKHPNEAWPWLNKRLAKIYGKGWDLVADEEQFADAMLNYRQQGTAQPADLGFMFDSPGYSMSKISISSKGYVLTDPKHLSDFIGSSKPVIRFVTPKSDSKIGFDISDLHFARVMRGIRFKEEGLGVLDGQTELAMRHRLRNLWEGGNANPEQRGRPPVTALDYVSNQRHYYYMGSSGVTKSTYKIMYYSKDPVAALHKWKVGDGRLSLYEYLNIMYDMKKVHKDALSGDLTHRFGMDYQIVNGVHSPVGKGKYDRSYEEIATMMKYYGVDTVPVKNQ